MRASPSATTAMNCTVILFALGMSQATNSTPDLCSMAVTYTERASRSSFAITRIAFDRFACAMAFCKAGRFVRSSFAADSTSVYRDQVAPERGNVPCDGSLLTVESETRTSLFVRRHAVVRDHFARHGASATNPRTSVY